MIPHGIQHRYYARDLGTSGAVLQPAQFPRGHGALGQGQGTICTDSVGNAIPCGTGEVMATLPALPGGGWVPSGQNIQTAPPPATAQALPAGYSSSTFMGYLPFFLAGGFLLLLLPGRRRGGGDSGGDRPRRRRGGGDSGGDRPRRRRR